MRRFNIIISDLYGTTIEETPLADYNIARDILTPVKSTAVLPYISSAVRGNFVTIYNPQYYIGYYTYRVHQGYISDIVYGKNITTLYILPIEAILNTNIHYSTSGLETDLQGWIVNMIKSVVVNNSDGYMNFLFSMVLDTTTTIVGADLGIESNIFNPFSLLKTVLLKYGLRVYLSFGNGTFQITISDISTAGGLIELNNPNVYNYSLDFSTNMLNKIIYVNTDDESEKLSYFLASDGTISCDDSYLRILPVIQNTVFYIPELNFSTETAILANTALQVSEENFLIEIEGGERNLLSNSIPFLIFCTKYNIKNNDTIYVGTLTAYEVLTDGTVKLTFGAVRADLTTLLGLERK
ncbi:MAG: hypothetical protein WCQ71_04640 [Bacilli bacterium]